MVFFLPTPPPLLWYSLSFLEVIQVADWESKNICDAVGVIGYFTSRKNCNAGGVLTQKSIFLFFSTPRSSHRQLCKEDGEKKWWQINTGCPSSLSWEKAAKSTGFKWNSERNRIMPQGKPVWCSCGGYVCIMQSNKLEWRRNFCSVVHLSVRALKFLLPLLYAARKSYQAEFCCYMSLATL